LGDDELQMDIVQYSETFSLFEQFVRFGRVCVLEPLLLKLSPDTLPGTVRTELEGMGEVLW
jgi:hypothetical protein